MEFFEGSLSNLAAARQEVQVLAQALGGPLDWRWIGRAEVGVSTERDTDGQWVTGEALIPTDDLDDYPSPWLDGVLDPADWDEAIMLTSRGCPHHCAFCVTPAAFGPTIRAHSVERVIEDITVVARHGRGRIRRKSAAKDR